MKNSFMENELGRFEESLREDERAGNTVSKYVRDVRRMLEFLAKRARAEKRTDTPEKLDFRYYKKAGKEAEKENENEGYPELNKEDIIAYKKYLILRGYKPTSINSMLAAINRYLEYTGHPECRVKQLKLQPRTYLKENEELSREEYGRLIAAAQKDERMKLILETLCSTGIRVSELKNITVEAVRTGEVEINSKGKIRVIILPDRLKQRLTGYCKIKKINTGSIFITKSGKEISRTYIWSRMKHLCRKAGVNERKVFPHNLRKLFARCFYNVKRDIVKLADILGHSSINTTRIYIKESGTEHRRILNMLRLVQ